MESNTTVTNLTATWMSTPRLAEAVRTFDSIVSNKRNRTAQERLNERVAVRKALRSLGITSFSTTEQVEMENENYTTLATVFQVR